MIKIAVCDDESEIRKSIANLIKKHTGDVEISVFQSGKEMLETTAYFDIAFLDIAMSGGNQWGRGKWYFFLSLRLFLYF